MSTYTNKDRRKGRALANAKKANGGRANKAKNPSALKPRGKEAEAALQERINDIAKNADLKIATEDPFHEHFRRCQTLRGSRVG